MFLHSFIYLAIFLNVARSQLFDLTRTPDASGAEVVEAVTDILGKTCIFPDELLYLRRVAYVESHDGLFLNATVFDGGIWRVDEATFNQTKTDPSLAALRASIQNTLFINWTDTVWSDLRQPLFSAIAAEFSAILKTGSAGIPNTVETQATLWGGAARANVFVRLVAELSKRHSYMHDTDIVFVLDSSASLSPADFEKAKEFTEKVLQGFDVNGGIVRVGVVAYSTIVYPQLDLNNGLSQEALLGAVANISYTPGGTATHAALQYVLDKAITPGNGARDNSVKIVILVTDGRSDDRVATVENAMKLRASGVNLFTVGVGEAVDQNELTRVASSPPCVHVKMVSNYTSLPAINFEIQQQSLKSAVILKPGSYNFSCDAQIKTLILPSASGQTTVEVTTNDGKLSLYGSTSNVFSPSSVLYSFNETIERGIPAQIYIRDGSQIGLAFKNMTSDGCNSTFSVVVTPGDRITTGTRVTCVGAGITSTCTSTDYDKSSFIVTGKLDPSLLNICGDKDLFMAPYPKMSDRYLYCSSGNMIVILCPTGQLFDVTTSTCKIGTVPPTTQPTAAPTTQPLVTGTTNVAQTTAHATKPAATISIQQVATTQTTPMVNPCTADAISSGLFIFPYPLDNRAFIKCGVFALSGNVLYCPPHEFFDESINTCIFHEVIVNATNLDFSNQANPCNKNHAGDVEYHPHPTDPQKFIQCDAFGEAFEKDCRPNTVWRQDVLTCVNTGLNFGTSGVGK